MYDIQIAQGTMMMTLVWLLVFEVFMIILCFIAPQPIFQPRQRLDLSLVCLVTCPSGRPEFQWTLPWRAVRPVVTKFTDLQLECVNRIFYNVLYYYYYY